MTEKRGKIVLGCSVSGFRYKGVTLWKVKTYSSESRKVVLSLFLLMNLLLQSGESRQRGKEQKE